MDKRIKSGSEIVKKATLSRLMLAIACADSELEQAKIRRQMKRAKKEISRRLK